MSIMRSVAQRDYGWALEYGELRAGLAVLEKERMKKHFGNAGAVNNLLATAVQRIQHLSPSAAPTSRRPRRAAEMPRTLLRSWGI